MDFGTEKMGKFVRYNREFIITKFVITEFVTTKFVITEFDCISFNAAYWLRLGEYDKIN